MVASEKGFKEYYDEGFALSALPYPGVQYFKNFVPASGTGAYPRPPWKKFKLEPRFGRPMRLPSPYRWQEYKAWSQLELTQNIVRYLFSILRDPKCSGMLIHCISGWDRTPHFVCLLRILLWAEGEAHQSLNVDQMLYLTIAYDWFLFGHQLSHRLKKQQEIMFYTFDVLGHLLAADFSLYLGDFAHLANARTNPSQQPMPSSSAPASPPSSARVEEPATSSASSSESNVHSHIPSTSAPSPTFVDQVAASSHNIEENTKTSESQVHASEGAEKDASTTKIESDVSMLEIDSQEPKHSVTSDILGEIPVGQSLSEQDAIDVQEPKSSLEDPSSPPAVTLPADSKVSPISSTTTQGNSETPIAAATIPVSSPRAPVDAKTGESKPPTTPRSAGPTVAEMLNQSVVGLPMDDKIDARKHRLFEIRDRFFYFYKTHVYPTYRK